MKKKSGFMSKWKRFANHMGRIQTFVLMTIIYFLIVPFFSLVRFSDPLKLKLKKKSTTYWEAKKPVDTSLERMKQLN
jgi:low affinity Fe/Cu permease